MGVLLARDRADVVRIGASFERVGAAWPIPEGALDLSDRTVPSPYRVWGWTTSGQGRQGTTVIAFFLRDRLLYAGYSVGPLTGDEAAEWLEAYEKVFGEPDKVERAAGHVVRTYNAGEGAVTIRIEDLQMGADHTFSATLEGVGRDEMYGAFREKLKGEAK